MRLSAAGLLIAVALAAPSIKAQCGTEETLLPDPTSDLFDLFGEAVDLAGDVVVGGAIQTDGGYYYEYPGPGVVRVFRFDGVQWNHEQSFAEHGPRAGAGKLISGRSK